VDVRSTVARLDKTVKAILFKECGSRHGFVTAVDTEGTAEWNVKKFRPAVQVKTLGPGGWSSDGLACRVKCLGASDNAGLWLPPIIGQSVVVQYFGTMLAPFVDCNSFYTDQIRNPPTEATPTNMVLKYKGHVLIFEKEGENDYLTLKASDGTFVKINVTTSEFEVSHKSGSNIKIDQTGKLVIVVKGGLSVDSDGPVAVDATGDVTIDSDGSVRISGKLLVELSSETQINLKTAGLLLGMLTAATNPCCVLTGVPFFGHPSILGG
jgi:hypothetical protein